MSLPSRFVSVLLSSALAVSMVPLTGSIAVAANPEPSEQVEQAVGDQDPSQTAAGGSDEGEVSSPPADEPDQDELQGPSGSLGSQAEAGVDGADEAVSEDDLPLGGPLESVAQGASAALSSSIASSAASYAPKREYLMPVLTGQDLGQNGRYVGSGTPWINPWNWASVKCSSTAADGSNVRVTSACEPGKLTTTVLNPTNRTVVSTKTINLSGALPEVGGVEVMPDGHIYLLTGQDNPSEADGTAVYRVTKYNTSLSAVGNASITSGQVWSGVQYPFEGGPPVWPWWARRSTFIWPELCTRQGMA